VEREEFDYAALGKRVKRERERCGWTQAQLAEHAGVSNSHICSIERGRVEFSVRCLVQLANTFGMPSDALIGDAIYAHEIKQKEINDALSDCNPQEIKFISDFIVSLKESLRKNIIDDEN